MKIILFALLVSLSAFSEEQKTQAEPTQYNNLTINRVQIDADLARFNAEANATRTVPEMRNGKVIGRRKIKLKQESLVTTPNN